MLITFYVKFLDFDKMSGLLDDGDNPFPHFSDIHSTPLYHLFPPNMVFRIVRSQFFPPDDTLRTNKLGIYVSQ